MIDEYESADGKSVPVVPATPVTSRRPFDGRSNNHPVPHLPSVPGTLLAPADMADANSRYSRSEGETRTKTCGLRGGRIVVSYVICPYMYICTYTRLAKCKGEVRQEGCKYCLERERKREYTF